MTETQTTIQPVRRAVTVERPLEDAFRVFTEGLGLAGGYITDHLAEWGVKPAGDEGTYLQTVKLLGVSAGLGDANPVSVSDAAAAGETTIPEIDALSEESTADSNFAPTAVFSVTGN